MSLLIHATHQFTRFTYIKLGSPLYRHNILVGVLQSQAQSSRFYRHKVLTHLPTTPPAGVNNDLSEGKPADGGGQHLWDRLARTMQVQPVLLNKQDDTSFALASTASKAFSRRVQINTVGGKGSVRIKVWCNISSHATAVCFPNSPWAYCTRGHPQFSAKQCSITPPIACLTDRKGVIACHVASELWSCQILCKLCMTSGPIW